MSVLWSEGCMLGGGGTSGSCPGSIDGATDSDAVANGTHLPLNQISSSWKIHRTHRLGRTSKRRPWHICIRYLQSAPWHSVNTSTDRVPLRGRPRLHIPQLSCHSRPGQWHLSRGHALRPKLQTAWRACGRLKSPCLSSR